MGITQSAINQVKAVLSKKSILKAAIERLRIYSLRLGDLMKSISSISSSVLNKKPATAEMAKSILCQRAIVGIHICHAVGLSYRVDRVQVGHLI
jgi:hypothetical protein